MVEYELVWASKVVESDIVEVIAFDKWQAENEVKKLIQTKNKRANVNIKSTVQLSMK
nr:hypothetical protein [Mycobacterium sp. E3298]